MGNFRISLAAISFSGRTLLYGASWPGSELIRLFTGIKGGEDLQHPSDYVSGSISIQQEERVLTFIHQTL
jgi:hypothetical protein